MFDSIVEAVFRHAEQSPDRLCLADDNGRITYRAYAQKIARLAGAFAREGVAPGDRVVVEACQTIDYLAAELALQRIGAIFVPLEHNCVPGKIDAIADRVQAVAIIACRPGDGARRWCYEDLARMESEAAPFESETWPGRADVGEILFSTGTTGREKGIVLTHGNDIALAENVIHGVEMAADNVEMIPSPMNHSHGLRRYYGDMVNGSSVVVLGSAMNMKQFFKNMDEYNVNALDLVPAALTAVLKLSRGRLKDYADRIRYIQFGAAPMPEADRREICRLLPHSRLYNFYGSTESGCVALYNFNRPDAKPNCIGKPACNARLFFVDDDRREIETSAERAGLLASAGSMNMLGYWQDDEETARAMANGAIYSNDEAYLDADGDIILLGRRGYVINVGGSKVAPEEIEDAAMGFEGVADCAAVPVSDPHRGDVPKLYVQSKPGCAVDFAALRAFLAGRLEAYKVPALIEAIDRIPRTYNGKLLRRELMGDGAKKA
ncbi:MAG: acyl--CoA ligase [Clostridia bacterium]|nr:acyl--CoA ligase [Clostridia bacterium]